MLRHVNVGGVDRAEHETERAGDVERSGQHPHVAWKRRTHRDVRVGIDRPTRGGQVRGQHQVRRGKGSDHEHAHRDVSRQLAARSSRGDDGDGAHERDHERHRPCGPGARVARGMAEQQRQQAADENRRPGEVSEA